MGGICINRPEGGIGFFKGELTTCTFDVVLLPLGSFFAIIMFVLCFALRRRFPGDRDHEAVPMEDYSSKSTSAVNREAIQSYRSEREKRQSHYGRRLGLAVVAGLMLLACFGLEAYEMYRLDQAKLGIGLLPIVPVGLTLIFLTLFIPTHGTNKYPRLARPHFLPWAITCFVFGILNCVLMGVRLNSLIRMGQLVNMDKNSGKSKNYYAVATRKFNTILLCVFYAVFSIAYSVLWVQDAKA